MVGESIDALLSTYADAESHPSEWNWDGLQSDFGNTFFMGFASSAEERESTTPEKLSELMQTTVEGSYRRRIDLVGEQTFHEVEKAIVLHTIDTCWQDHLYEMDELKEGVGFVGVGGKNPLIEYKKGAYDLFENLIARINEETLRHLFQLRVDVDMPDVLPPRGSSGRYSSLHREATNLGFDGAAPEGRAAPPTMEGVTAGSQGRDGMATSGGGAAEITSRQPKRVAPKVGRNEPCPCGSGKKYKRCCGAGG